MNSHPSRPKKNKFKGGEGRPLSGVLLGGKALLKEFISGLL
jgi:hypothetical protein